MLPDELLHPDHVVPAPELVSALMKPPDLRVAEVRMKLRAVPGQVLIVILNGVADAGVKVEYMLLSRNPLELRVQKLPDP